jgi:serine/threonine protein kinase
MSEKANPPAAALPVSQLLEIDKVCRQFEADWKAGRRPNAADYLGDTPEPQLSELKRELDAIETELRAKSKLQFSVDEFVRRITSTGLMTDDEVSAFVSTLPAEQKPKTAEELARQMHRRGRLTKFQAQAIYQGKTRGLVLGNYVVLDRLGHGGMGEVYKARHRKMERLVALKMLPSSAAKLPEAVKRFEREAKAAARLSLPNIVTAYDADEAGGVHFLVMEYVDGKDLAAMVKTEGVLGVAQAVDYIVQAARGLEYAHAQGIVHRDIKPSNLLLDRGGAVKILDMGLARIDNALGGSDDGLTHSGYMMGTLDFMAPEQALDTHDADARSDVYSLGCTLYYLLTGKAPFRGDTVAKKLLAHREEPVPTLAAERSDVPAWLDQAFQRMLAKNPADRPQTMGQVVRQLRQHELPWTPPPATAVATAQRGLDETLSLHEAKVDTSSRQIDIDEPWQPPTEPLPFVPPRKTKRRMPAAWAKLSKRQRIVVGAAAGAMFFAILLAIVISLRTKDGTLVVELDDPDVTLQILSERGEVQIERKGEKGRTIISVDPGKHRLRVQKNGVEVFGQEFSLASDGKETIRARWQPSPAVPPSPVIADDPWTTNHWLGYVLGDEPGRWMPEVAAYTNIVWDSSWELDDDPRPRLEPTLKAARKHDLKAIVSIGGKKRLDKFLEVGVELVRSYSDVVVAVCVSDAPFFQVSPQDCADFCSELKKRLPKVKVLCYQIDVGKTPQADPIPDAVDVLVVDILECATVEESRRRIKDVMPLWFAKAGKRPVFLVWDSFMWNGSGLVPTCDAGVLRAWADFAKSKRLAGFAACNFGPCNAAGQNLVPIRTRPELVQEMRDIAKDWGVKSPKNSTGTAPDEELDRAVAQWALTDIGGIATITAAGEERTIKDAGQLPQEPFLLTGLDFKDKKTVNDETLKRLEGLKHLCALNLDGTLITDAGTKRLQELTSLWKLDLANTDISNQSLQHVKALKSLRMLGLHGTHVDHSGLAWLAELTMLQDLNLNQVPITDADVIQIENLKQLRCLGLWNTKITDAALPHLARLKSLNRLILWDTSVTDAAMQHLVTLPRLNFLCVAGSRVTDEGIKELQKFEDLQGLEISAPPITAKGLDFLKQCKKLTALTLRGSFTDADIARLADNKNLRSLAVFDSKITEVGLSALKRALPDCDIQMYRNWQRVDEKSLASRAEEAEKAPEAEKTPEAADVAGTVELPASYHARKIAHNAEKASWAPDSRRIVFGRLPFGTGLNIADVQSGKVTEFLDVGKDPAWSPGNGRWIAFVKGGTILDEDEVWIVDSNGQNSRKIGDGGFPSWSSDGKTLFFNSRLRKKVLAARPAEKDSPVTELCDMPLSAFSSVSPDGTKISCTDDGGVLRIIDRDTKRESLRIPSPTSGVLIFHSWTPDGKQILLGNSYCDSAIGGLWMLDLDTKRFKKIAPHHFTMPFVSPDGSKLAVDSRNEDGSCDVWVIEMKYLAEKVPGAVQAPVPK